MGYSNISESLLEMHYFRLLVRRYKRLLGRSIEIFKPATTTEHWYGFDQAYFTSDISKANVIRDLRAYISSTAAPRFSAFRAFLLQFKVVEIARKRSKHTPAGWVAPYFRAELYLGPNRNTGISQHEALRRLSGLAGASVAYVCPMIFEESDVLVRPRMSDLRFVDVASSPKGWLTAERHFVGFQNVTSPPTWCSEPTPGKALSMGEVVERATPLSAQQLFGLLVRIREVLRQGEKGEVEQNWLGHGEPNILPSSLSIVAEFSAEYVARP
jgi:hypothetical protein